MFWGVVWVVAGCLWGMLPALGGEVEQALKILGRAVESEGQMLLRGEVETTLQLEEGQAAAHYSVLQKPPFMFRLEYLEPEGLEKQLVISDGLTRWLYDEKGKAVFVSAAPDQFSLKRERVRELTNIPLRFKVRLLGVGSIAGRSAYVIQLIRKRRPLTARKFWVDTEKFFLLRTEHLAPDGSLLAAKGFTSVEFPEEKEIDDENFTFEPPKGTKVIPEPAPSFVTYDPLEAQKRVGFQIRLPLRLPPDFFLQDICVIYFRGRPVIWLRYTDSLNYLSIFERALPARALPPSEAPPPQMVVGVVGDLNVAIVGTLPIEFLLWVGNSLPL